MRTTLGTTQVLARVDEHYRLATRTAFERFGRFVRNHSGALITTVRALFDAWIDQAVATYTKPVIGDAFAHDFGARVDAGSDVRVALRALGGGWSALFDTLRRADCDKIEL